MKKSEEIFQLRLHFASCSNMDKLHALADSVKRSPQVWRCRTYVWSSWYQVVRRVFANSPSVLRKTFSRGKAAYASLPDSEDNGWLHKEDAIVKGISFSVKVCLGCVVI